jgi:hypothetical protein
MPVVTDTFTVDIGPMYGWIGVGSGGIGRPDRPQLPAGTWATIAAWTDERSPGLLALYPPNDRGGSDSVTVEVIEGDFLGHPGTGAEVVLMGEMTFPQPEIYIFAITSATHSVPFPVASGAAYRVWVSVAGRQESILNWERSYEDEDWEIPVAEHWWVTLQLA